MPDVIVKGMEMPSNCNECRLLGEGRWCWAIPVDETQPGPTQEDNRPDWCPLRPAPEWISVEERLPKTRPSILGQKSSKVIVAFQFDDGMQRTDTAHIFNEDWVFEDRITVVNRAVTHWMPLPEPPEGGDRDGT